MPANEPPGFSSELIPQRSIWTRTDGTATGFSIVFLVSFGGRKKRCITKNEETVGKTIQGIETSGRMHIAE